MLIRSEAMINPDELCLKCMRPTPALNYCINCGSPRIIRQELEYALPLKTILNGRYLVGSMLGSGGFGITYTGYDLIEDRIIAIKEFMPSGLVSRHPGKTVMQLSTNESTFNESKSRFLNEARMIHHYQHNPNILQVYSLFEENNTAYYVMEYLYGLDLAHLIKYRNGRISWDELRPIVLQIIYALSLLHEDKVVHRDISPDNIFISPNGKATLIDFGAARQYMAQKQLTIILKRNYAPIEQYRSKGEQGPWTDIYALSATMYHALTGMVPVEAPNRMDTPLLSFREQNVLLPDNVEKAIYKGLALKPEYRYQNVSDFKRDLLGNSTSRHMINCIMGDYANMTIHLNGRIFIGRNSNSCQLIYSQNTKGISGVHCLISADGSTATITDLKSTYGTYINGNRINADIPYTLNQNDRISFGENQVWVYERN